MNNTIYIYLFEGRYPKEHIDYMYGMLDSLWKASDLTRIDQTYRPDLKAWEYKVEASMWAYNFLHYMRDLDMLNVFENQL